MSTWLHVKNTHICKKWTLNHFSKWIRIFPSCFSYLSHKIRCRPKSWLFNHLLWGRCYETMCTDGLKRNTWMLFISLLWVSEMLITSSSCYVTIYWWIEKYLNTWTLECFFKLWHLRLHHHSSLVHPSIQTDKSWKKKMFYNSK